ncbi:MAG TPA: hypothetical protein VGH54_18970, partial [Mycobacterium sp.]
AKKTSTPPPPSTPSPEPASQAEAKPEPQAKEEPQSTPARSDAEDGGQAAPAAPVKGLGIARGARPPGKR